MDWLLAASLARAGDTTTVRFFGPVYEPNVLDGVWTSGSASAFGWAIFRGRGSLLDADPTWTESVEGASALLAHRETSGSLGLDAVVNVGLSSGDGSGWGTAERGSHLRVGWASPHGDDVSLTVWPLDGDPFRGGYAVDLGWGATYAEADARRPAARLSWRRGAAYAYAGARVGIQSQLDPETGTYRTGAFPGFLAGGGVAAGEHVRIEAGGGRIAQGQLLSVSSVDSPEYGAVVPLSGASARGTLLLGGAREPDDVLHLVAWDEAYPSQWHTPGSEQPGVSIAAEGAWLHQRLLDADGTARQVPATAGAVEVTGSLPRWTAGVDLTVRDVAFLTAPTMGLPQGYAAPEGTPAAELGVRGTVAAWVPTVHVAPLLGLRVLRPASVCPSSGACEVLGRWIETLPTDQPPAAVESAVAGAQWRPMPAVNLSAEVVWTHDPNQAELVATDEGGAYEPVDHLARGDLAVHLMYAGAF